MPLVTSKDFKLTPDTSQLTQILTRAIMQSAQQDRQDERLQQKQQAEQVKTDLAATSAQLLRVRDIKDNATQRKEIAILGQEMKKQGKDPSIYNEALNITNPDEMNLYLTRNALKGDQAKKFIEQKMGLTGEIPAEQQSFESLIKDFTPKEQVKARKIKAGLSPRATGSADQTILAEGIGEDIGKLKAGIKQREKFGEMTGSSRAKMIDKGFGSIVRINKGIGTIDRAIDALKGGAKTGAIQKHLPSIRAATVELKQIGNELALDVLGGVTLGAISKDELELAKMVGLPEGLTPPELIKHLENRKAAQEKLRNYYQEQIDFLDKGGTVAGFLRAKKGEQSGAPSQQDIQAPKATEQPIQPPVNQAAPQTITLPNGVVVRKVQ